MTSIVRATNRKTMSNRTLLKYNGQLLYFMAGKCVAPKSKATEANGGIFFTTIIAACIHAIELL